MGKIIVEQEERNIFVLCFNGVEGLLIFKFFKVGFYGGDFRMSRKMVEWEFDRGEKIGFVQGVRGIASVIVNRGGGFDSFKRGEKT